MDRLVAAGAEKGRAQDLLGVAIDQDLHETFSLALLESAGHVLHGDLTDAGAAAAPSAVGFGHPGPAQGRVGREGVGWKAVAPPPVIAVEQIGGDDLKIVVGGVGEGASPIAIAERPDTRHICAERIIHLDEATRLSAYAGVLEAEIVSIGPAADRDEQVRSANLRAAIGAFELHHDVVALLGDAQTPRIQAKIDAFTGEKRRNGLRDILVLTWDEARAYLDDCDLATEASVHLSKLEANVAATEHKQMPGQEIDIHHRSIGEVGDLLQAGDLRHDGTAADIDEDLLGAQDLRADVHFASRHKSRMALINPAVLQVLERSLDARSRKTRDIVLARLDAPHVYLDRALDYDAVVGAAASHMRGVGARDQRLRSRASRIDAIAAKPMALDDRHSHPRTTKSPRQTAPGWSTAADDRIERGNPVLPTSSRTRRNLPSPLLGR